MSVSFSNALTPTEESLTTFWSDIALQTLDWIGPWNTALEGSLAAGSLRWFQGGLLNACVNCVDRHLPHKAQYPALIWEGDEATEQRKLTFADLHREVCLMSNVLKKLGVKKGDVVAIYLPMIPEAVIAMLACARIGAVHTVVFAGFSALALKQRIQASASVCLITANAFKRGGKLTLLKEQADLACAGLSLPILLVQSLAQQVPFDSSTNYWWHEIKQTVGLECQPEVMEAEDPLFILYTSGSTGAPKGLVHTTAGYLVQAAYTHKWLFSCTEQDLFWCTADVGWITGHSYVVYGSLCNGVTSFIYAGIPTWPDAARNWQIIDRHKVSVFYTAPTAIRALMRAGDDSLQSSSRDSLRLLGSVGEPINPQAWQWYHQQVGKGRCPIVDTWWQTETGAVMLSPNPSILHNKPGSAGKPLPGIVPVILDEKGKELPAEVPGYLAIKYPWPSMARTILGDHARFCKTYLSQGYYITGDGASQDADGDFWISGRVDDVLNVAGHRLGTAEIESALVSYPAVAEAAVVGIPCRVKGEAIYAFVVLKQEVKLDDGLEAALVTRVKDTIGAIAKPQTIRFVSDLPKTRSGKIMRRILRQIASGTAQKIEDLNDLSTLTNPEVIGELFNAVQAE